MISLMFSFFFCFFKLIFFVNILFPSALRFIEMNYRGNGDGKNGLKIKFVSLYLSMKRFVYHQTCPYQSQQPLLPVKENKQI